MCADQTRPIAGRIKTAPDRARSQRTLRLADGPDEVHHFVVAHHEAGSYAAPAPGRSEALGDSIFAGP